MLAAVLRSSQIREMPGTNIFDRGRHMTCLADASVPLFRPSHPCSLCFEYDVVRIHLTVAICDNSFKRVGGGGDAKVFTLAPQARMTPKVSNRSIAVRCDSLRENHDPIVRGHCGRPDDDTNNVDRADEHQETALVQNLLHGVTLRRVFVAIYCHFGF